MASRTTPLSKILDAISRDDINAVQKLLRPEITDIRGTILTERTLLAGVADFKPGDGGGAQAFKRPAKEAAGMLDALFNEYAQVRVSKSITPPLVEMFELLGRWVGTAPGESAEQKARVAVVGNLIDQHWNLLDRAHRETVMGRLLTLSGTGGFNMVITWLTQDQRLEKLSDNGAFLRPVTLLRTPTIFIDGNGMGTDKDGLADGFEGWKRLVTDLLATAPLPKIVRTDLTPKAFENAMGRGSLGGSEQMASFLLSTLRPHLKPDFQKLADNLLVGPALETILDRADTDELVGFFNNNPGLAPIEGWAEFEKKAIARTANIANAVLEHESAEMRKTRSEHFKNLAAFANAALEECEKRAPKDEQAAKASSKSLVETLQRLRETAMRSQWYRQLETTIGNGDTRAEGIDRLEHLLSNPWNEVLRTHAKRRNPQWHDGHTPEELLARLKETPAPNGPRQKR